MQDLGMRFGFPYDTFSGAFGINDRSQVVGHVDDHSFLWTSGAAIDLNTLVPGNSGWELGWASDINNAGQIVRAGVYNGRSAAFLLTPIPEPSIRALIGLASPA